VRVELTGIGKRFGREWIFRDLNHIFEQNTSTAIIGNNGSGKSTLIKLVSTFIDPTLGHLTFSQSNPQHNIGYVAPYLELVEELTLLEHLTFHFQFRQASHSYQEMIDSANLDHAKNKHIMDFSSGMKQRLKLILAFFFTGFLAPIR
jgi:ABC-type multidrug transport system ATPase subunit